MRRLLLLLVLLLAGCRNDKACDALGGHSWRAYLHHGKAVCCNACSRQCVDLAPSAQSSGYFALIAAPTGEPR